MISLQRLVTLDCMTAGSSAVWPAAFRKKLIPGLIYYQTLLISFKLLESKIGVVSSTAAATLRQLIMFVFENVDAEDRAAAKAKEDPSIPG